ncbi:hypothetical protein TVAG_447290 [Trichomonas vaginalis G3]|uniref:DUF3447 domain-containing protein n=1 Tax=Trichomonas vaginalis (strain ATCC PRA-98 / G3) TaxID=412133 RepID=A2DS00_TRIV3|nr:protein kinase protein [Trichomonas vaginalis G3]EAY16770.1 hypothetical protein TVAG_447290 [Trichomonas vaginalis G3]KAI5490823.1 protein kinase protein [Trichomonas vaginalis G3]|eukprot:XP_001328993.1 hypothetical protein [Trichomonas vaginalis G3]
MIKTVLIDSEECPPDKIFKDILKIIPYNNRYMKSYLKLAKLIVDYHHILNKLDFPEFLSYLFYKEYGIKLGKDKEFQIKITNDFDVHSSNTIYRAIMDNDLKRFIYFTEMDGFDQDQSLDNEIYPDCFFGYSLLELCCYHGAVDCFKFLRTKFKSKITQKCLEFSFLGRNAEILSECLKCRKPDDGCMDFALISHDIYLVSFLMNEYHIKIDLQKCGCYNNLEAFIVYMDQTKDFDICFVYSPIFEIPSLCKYLLSFGANINAKDIVEHTALHIASLYNCRLTSKFLISHGAILNHRDFYGHTPLHFAALNNYKECTKLLLSNGAICNKSDETLISVLKRMFHVKKYDMIYDKFNPKYDMIFPNLLSPSTEKL